MIHEGINPILSRLEAKKMNKRKAYDGEPVYTLPAVTMYVASVDTITALIERSSMGYLVMFAV